VSKSTEKKVRQWAAEGVGKREIARRLHVTDKAVRKLLKRLGFKTDLGRELQGELPFCHEATADPNVSDSSAPTVESLPSAALDVEVPAETEAGSADPNVSDSSAPTVEFLPSAALDVEVSAEAEAGSADPNMSAAAAGKLLHLHVSQDPDPRDRSFDRILACLGLLEDAEPRFVEGQQVPRAGVLLAVPALVHSGVFEIAREVYGSLAPAFYGLRTVIVAFLLMALLRIKRPENIKEHEPADLGRLLGLDRAPEVKTLRRKLSRLAAAGRAAQFGKELAARRIETHGQALGFLYVDGHVRVYHGKRELPKTHVARMRISMPATSDFWVNDQMGDPLFVVTTEAHPSMVQVLPEVLSEIRPLAGEKRITVVFDRGGWSPKMFGQLIDNNFDVLTYFKGRFRPLPTDSFSQREEVIDGTTVRYVLADDTLLLNRGKLKMRRVTRLCDNGHQTPIVTSRWDLSAIEVAYRMFARWRQENFFKYLREEYALDALVDYGVEVADAERDVPNPARKKIDAEIQEANRELARLEGMYGLEALHNEEKRRATMRGFKIANAKLNRTIQTALQRLIRLEQKRAAIPSRVPLKQINTSEIVKLDVERKHLTNLLKMVAYQAESELVRQTAPHFHRCEDEGRTLVQTMLSATGSVNVVGQELRVSLAPLSSPHRTQALAHLCAEITATHTKFPGTDLTLSYEVLPLPPPSMAFPGPKTTEPDISERA
jgi:prepilin-type processing-associated H-X9-DG protein